MSREQISNGPTRMNHMPQEGKKYLVFFCVIPKFNVVVTISFLEKYPQIKKLFGHDPNFKWIVISMILVQFVMVVLIKDLPWILVLGLAYCFGGVINHSLMLGSSSSIKTL